MEIGVIEKAPAAEVALWQQDYSGDAERAVIGSMLIDAACVKDVLNAVEADDFYINTNQEVFTAIRRMHVAAKPIDGLTVASELEREGLYSSETRNYLLQCMEITPTSANVLEYAGIVRKKAEKRRFTKAVMEALATDEDPQAAVAAICHQKMRSRRGGRLKTMSDAMSEAMSSISGKKEGRIDTGFPLLDATLKGLWPGQLILVGARPGCGKSAMCMEMTEAAAMKGKTVLHITAEMLAGEVGERLLAKRADGVTEIPLDALTAQQPKAVYVLLGSNVLGRDTDYTSFLTYYRLMLDMISQALPDAKIYVQSITPVRPEVGTQANHAGLNRDRLCHINNELAAIALEKNCYFLNLWEVLADENGDLIESYAQPDGYHIKPEGYAVWVDYLCSHTME